MSKKNATQVTIDQLKAERAVLDYAIAKLEATLAAKPPTKAQMNERLL